MKITPLLLLLIALLPCRGTAQYVGPSRITARFRVYGANAKPIQPPEYHVQIDTSNARYTREARFGSDLDIHVSWDSTIEVDYLSTRSYKPHVIVSHGPDTMRFIGGGLIDSIPFKPGFFREPDEYAPVFRDQCYSHHIFPLLTDFPEPPGEPRPSASGLMRSLICLDGYRNYGESWEPLQNNRQLETVQKTLGSQLVACVRNTSSSKNRTPATELFFSSDEGRSWRKIRSYHSDDSIIELHGDQNFAYTINSRREVNRLIFTDTIAFYDTDRIEATPETRPASHMSFKLEDIELDHGGAEQVWTESGSYVKIGEMMFHSPPDRSEFTPFFPAGAMPRIVLQEKLGFYITNDPVFYLTRDGGKTWQGYPFDVVVGRPKGGLFVNDHTVCVYGPYGMSFVDISTL